MTGPLGKTAPSAPHATSSPHFCASIRKIAYNEYEEIIASIVVCAEPSSWQQASRFAQKVLGNAELKSERRFNPARVLDQHSLSSSPHASVDSEARQSRCGDLLCKSPCSGGGDAAR